MVVDPLRRFVYVANLVSNAADQATISMYTINSGTGNLTLTSPPTVPTGFFPQGIGIDPSGHFACAAKENGASVLIHTLKSNVTLPPAGTAATQGAALSVVLSGTNSKTDNQTKSRTARFSN